MGKFKRYGNNQGLVLLIDEEKLDLNIIEQLKNYLDAKEKELKKKKKCLSLKKI